jgi:hypothetical protein
VEPVVQAREIREHVLLRASRRPDDGVAGLVRFARARQTTSTLLSLLFLACLLAISLGTPSATAQSGRTFWASSPLRPGTTSNSTA